MVIRSSSVRQLVAELRAPDPVRRDAAIARLRVLGSDAVPRLSALVAEEIDGATRVAALRALEGIEDPRVPATALRAFADRDPDVRLAAVAALSPWVARESDTRVMEALVAAAMDREQPAAIRLAALDALSELPREIVQPILEQAPVPVADPLTAIEPAGIHEWLHANGDAPLSVLHALIARTRERERSELSAAARAEWLVLRGAVHAVLARRRSRVALYDLREAFDAATSPLPLDFLTAIAAIGDGTCLDALARAWAAAPPGEDWWKTRLRETAAAITREHRLTGRHDAVKRVQTAWPGFLGAKR